MEEPDLPRWGTGLFSILILLTITANLLVIASFLSEPRLLKHHFNLYLLNLAVTDLLVGVIAMPHYAMYSHYGYWPFTHAHCSFWMFFDYLLTSESLWGIAAISVDRVWAVCVPFSYRNCPSYRKCLLASVLSWTIAVAVLLPGFVKTRREHLNATTCDCDWMSEGDEETSSAVVVLVLGEWLPVIITVVCFLITTGKLMRISVNRKKRIAETGIVTWRRHGSCRVRDAQDRQAFVLQTLLVVAVLLTWMPWFVESARKLLLHREDGVFYIVAYCVAYGLSGLNPFLFNAASAEMRLSLRSFLRRTLCSRGSGDGAAVHPRPSPLTSCSINAAA
ncbi:hypothetical protein BV898_16817 [Hypsibius exemplaris]|uniref:G-protein coupled receptors family 1 profile domain-containing protein n=1 Tax=Hypsibius exemplaris TaxID=2072580 RepID=A0A9X6NDV9_HYPEX|nr:hypothetical protein BV898_16817 [Hypsibius exemplaris]